MRRQAFQHAYNVKRLNKQVNPGNGIYTNGHAYTAARFPIAHFGINGIFNAGAVKLNRE